MDIKGYPLEGLKVLDLSRVLAGPFATRMLSDLGADVLKIEPPEGDVTRHFGKSDNGVAGFYLQQNVGKRNICIDLKTEGARELVLDLCRKADVLVENFRPGVMKRFGLDWESIHAVNPKLVMLSISGFGQTGPESKRAAYAPVVHAETGLIARQAEMSGGPA
ncbi:MAG: CoA transferase, partial [Henriciella sp.]|uniref:CaiB/BaiF CoA transferase family protein n=1 Tax=Henriciella sp. TaxID=1968823 RepID=UPI003C7242AC